MFPTKRNPLPVSPGKPNQALPMKISALTLSLALSSLAVGYTYAQDSEEQPAGPVDYRRSSLVERTPFARNDRGRVAHSVGGPVELRGFYGSGKDLLVSLTRVETGESAWVKVGDKSAKWPVEAADVDDGTADVKFDNMKLHLKLARAGETGDAQPAASPAVVQVVEQVKTEAKKSGFGSMSAEGRAAMQTAMKQARDAAHAAHPELYDRSKPLTAEQQAAKAELEKANWAKVRAEVGKVSADDAAALPEAPFGRGSRGGEGGGGRGGSSGGRGGRGRNSSGGDGVGLQIGNSAPAPSQAPAR